MHPELAGLERRIEALERQNRVLRYGCCLLLGLSLLGGGVGVAQLQPQAVVASSVVIFGEDQKPRIAMAVTPKGPTLSWTDNQGVRHEVFQPGGVRPATE